MRRREDDLTAWQDDPVVRALTGPATGDELAGEEHALAAFRAAVPVRSRRRYLGRVGVGGSALGIALALSGGVAAAYTSTLPSPLQRVAHELGSSIGVPAPAPHHDRHTASKGTPSVAPSPSPTPSGLAPVVTQTPALPAPSSKPSTKPAGDRKPGAKSHPKSTPSTVASSPTVTPTPTPTPTPPPTPTPTPIVPGSITITVGTTTVAVNTSVSVLGHLAASSGAPITGRRVWLIERPAGQTGANVVAMGFTDADGSVALTSPALTHTARLRLVTDESVKSAPVTVVVVPTVTASVELQGSTYAVTVTTDGGNPGDTVELQRRNAGVWISVATTSLDLAADATFNVPAPPKQAAHYRVILPRTVGHGFAMTRFATPPL